VILCGACNNIIVVDCNGDVYPSQSLMIKNLKITNILEKNYVNEIIKSKIRKYFTNINVLKLPVCKKCHFNFLCGGRCPAIIYRLFNKFNVFSKEWCNVLYNDAVQRLYKTNFNSIAKSM